jgi:hypothetical protein
MSLNNVFLSAKVAEKRFKLKTTFSRETWSNFRPCANMILIESRLDKKMKFIRMAVRPN